MEEWFELGGLHVVLRLIQLSHQVFDNVLSQLTTTYFFLLLVSIGHDTVMAKVLFFGTDIVPVENVFDFSHEYTYQNELHSLVVRIIVQCVD